MDTIELENEKPINGIQNGGSHEVSNGVQNGFSSDKSSENIIKEIKYSLQTCPTKITSGASSLNGSLLNKDVFYPYQKAPYISPNYNLSSDSKRMVRRLQGPSYAAAPGTVHIVYEVWKLNRRNFALKQPNSVSLFCVLCLFFVSFVFF